MNDQTIRALELLELKEQKEEERKRIIRTSSLRDYTALDNCSYITVKLQFQEGKNGWWAMHDRLTYVLDKEDLEYFKNKFKRACAKEYEKNLEDLKKRYEKQSCC